MYWGEIVCVPISHPFKSTIKLNFGKIVPFIYKSYPRISTVAGFEWRKREVLLMLFCCAATLFCVFLISPSRFSCLRWFTTNKDQKRFGRQRTLSERMRNNAEDIEACSSETHGCVSLWLRQVISRRLERTLVGLLLRGRKCPSLLRKESGG